MSTTIDSLDIQITTSSGSAAANIDQLAASLGRLKENAKLTTTLHNLTKLKSTLDGLKDMSAGLQSVASVSEALRDLQSIQKLSGLSSAMSALKKLPSVVAELDTATLDAFGEKMSRLSTALAPLATQLNAVGTAFSRLPSKIKQIVAGTNRMATATTRAANAQKRHRKALNTTSINLSALIFNVRSYISVVKSLVTKLSEFMADAIEWDGIQFRFGRAFGEDAEEVYGWIQKVNDALGINIQQFMQYSSLYGSLLSGFGMAQKQVTTISVGLTELSYDIWAAYNDRYKTLESASEAVRSAITGEIEPIRNAGIALTEASMQEYLDSIGMATVRMSSLSEAQKAEVRYAVMVNSAMNQGIVGTYARETTTAEGAVRTLTQQLKTLGQALGSLLLPLFKAIVPWLSALVSLLTEGIQKLAQIFGITLQKITWDNSVSGAQSIAGGLEDATESAKELKKQLFGFDELNILTANSAESSAFGGGSLGLDTGTLWDEELLKQAKQQANELTDKIRDFFHEWKTEIAIIAAMIGAIKLTGLLNSAAKLTSSFKIWGSLFAGLMNKVRFISDVFLALKGASFAPQTAGFTTLVKLAPKLGVITLAVAGLASMLYFLKENWDKVKQAAQEFFDLNIAPHIESLRESWNTVKEAFANILAQFPLLQAVFQKIKAWLNGLELPSFGEVVEAVGMLVFKTITGPIAKAIQFIMPVIDAAMKIVAAFIDLFSDVTVAISNMWASVVSWFKDKVAPKFTKAFWTEKFQGLKEGFTTTIRNAINVGIDHMNRFIGWLNEKLRFSWNAFSIGGKQIIPAGSIQLFTIPQIPHLAEGGFVDTGQLFIAREAGPELVGNINGRTAVANNEQIVEGIASGVRSANDDLISVAYAMAQQIVRAINEKESTFYLDSKKISTAQRQRSRALGV